MAYTLASVSINSSTVPVQIIAVGDKIAWVIRVRSSAAANVLLFPFTGTLPANLSGITNFMELSAAQFIQDADAIGSLTTDAMNSGWAGVLEIGSTAVAVDGIWR